MPSLVFGERLARQNNRRDAASIVLNGALNSRSFRCFRLHGSRAGFRWASAGFGSVLRVWEATAAIAPPSRTTSTTIPVIPAVPWPLRRPFPRTFDDGSRCDRWNFRRRRDRTGCGGDRSLRRGGESPLAIPLRALMPYRNIVIGHTVEVFVFFQEIRDVQEG